MIYDLSKEIDRERAQKRFKALLEEKTVVTLTKKVKRSVSQSNYLYLIFGWFSMETGFSVIETKQMYKKLNSNIYEYGEKDFRFMRSTADLDSGEMTLSIEKFRDYSAQEAGIYLPAPNEEKFLQEIEIEMQRNRI